MGPLAAVACILGPIASASAQPDPSAAPEAAPAPAPAPAPVAEPDPAPAPLPPGPWLDQKPSAPSDPVAPAPDLAPALVVRKTEIHGFVTQGAFLSTSNEYIGHSSSGSLKMTEVGLNVSTEIADWLRAGVQVFSREVGVYDDAAPRIDWAFLDYRYKPWLGLRAGVIKMPYGLYNEYEDIDSARVPILMPQSVYPVRNREALLAHRGFSIYGEHALGGAGSVEYQAWLGTLSVPDNALLVGGATLDSIETKYVTGAQLFWHPPIEGLRVGGSWTRASFDFYLTVDPANVAALIMAGLVPPDYKGALIVSERPSSLVIGSAEYARGPWLFAAEFTRSFSRQRSSFPALLPTIHTDREGMYAQAGYQLSPRFATSLYYSIDFAAVGGGFGASPLHTSDDLTRYQKDVGATLRFDVNDHWLWKVEAHFMDGALDLDAATTPKPDRYWGMFLAATTVTF